MIRGVWLGILVFATAGCSKAAPSAAHASILVTDDGQRCGASVSELKIDDLDAPGAMERLVGAVGRRSDVHILNATPTVRFKCVGGLIYALQRSGVAKIGFISEPPSAVRP